MVHDMMIMIHAQILEPHIHTLFISPD